MLELTRRGFLQTATATAVGSSALVQRLGAAAADLFLRSPNVQNVSINSASVLWTLPVQAAGSVVIADPSGGLKSFAATATKFDPATTGMDQAYYQYRASLEGLTPDTPYSYQIRADGQPLASSLTRPLQFRTAPNGAFSFLHLADCGTGTADEVQLSLQIVAEQVSLALANGDLAYDLATYGSIEANYYGVYRELMAQVPFFASLGNHEYYTDAGQPSLAARVTPTDGIAPADWGRYYSFDWGNAHFVALDTNLPLTDAVAGTGQMLQWLDADLQRTRKFWRIVFFHHPGYATGHHQDEPEAGSVRQYIVPILEAHGVQLVFNGHEHTYQRTHELLGGQVVAPNSGGIVYVTSGGGGADVYWTAPNDLIAQSIGMNNYVRADVSGPTIALRVRGLGQGSDIDSIVLAPKPQVAMVVNAASFTPDLASGGLVCVFGRNLSSSDVNGSLEKPLLDAQGCSVTLNGASMPLFYAGASQINLQIPIGFSGRGTLTVQTPNGSAEAAVYVKPVAPALFANPAAPESALAVHQDWSLIDSGNPANAGETITLFLTGLGSGTGDVRVRFGNVDVAPISVTSGANAAGVYEVRAQIPVGVLSRVAVSVVAAGVSSNTCSLPMTTGLAATVSTAP